MSDDEVFAEVAELMLEREADRLVAALLQAERAVATKDPALLAALDANAAEYGEARDTWVADMECGDLSLGDPAIMRAKELRGEALTRMVGIFFEAESAGTPQTAELYDAVKALWQFEVGLGGECDYICEYVAGDLGEAGPRYMLGF